MSATNRTPPQLSQQSPIAADASQLQLIEEINADLTQPDERIGTLEVQLQTQEEGQHQLCLQQHHWAHSLFSYYNNIYHLHHYQMATPYWSQNPYPSLHHSTPDNHWSQEYHPPLHSHSPVVQPPPDPYLSQPTAMVDQFLVAGNITPMSDATNNE